MTCNLVTSVGKVLFLNVKSHSSISVSFLELWRPKSTSPHWPSNPRSPIMGCLWTSHCESLIQTVTSVFHRILVPGDAQWSKSSLGSTAGAAPISASLSVIRALARVWWCRRWDSASSFTSLGLGSHACAATHAQLKFLMCDCCYGYFCLF